MKFENGKNINQFLKIIGIYILVVFVLSLIVSHRFSHKENVNPDEICVFAREFMTNDYYIKIGESVDCSGYTQLVYKKFGYNIPRSSAQQFKRFFDSQNILQPGDLVFFSNNGKNVSHVGIYLKDSIFVHSPGKNKKVKIDDLSKTYWKSKLKGTGRVVKGQS